MRHVDPELRADLVRDRAERGEVELPRVGGPAGDDHRRPVLEGGVAHAVHVDAERLRVDPVGDGVVELPREVQLHAVRQVAAVGELEPEDRVAGLREGGEHRGVRGGAGVGLHVGEAGVEQRLGAGDRQLLRDVDDLAAAVVAAAGVALRVLVREHAAGRGEHGAGHEVLARDHLERGALALQLVVQDGGDLRIHLLQRRVERGAQGGGGDGGVGHVWLLVGRRVRRSRGSGCGRRPGERRGPISRSPVVTT